MVCVQDKQCFMCERNSYCIMVCYYRKNNQALITLPSPHFLLLLYSLGDIPMDALKHLEKYFGSENPHE